MKDVSRTDSFSISRYAPLLEMTFVPKKVKGLELIALMSKFVFLERFNKYLSIVLLAVFAWVTVPTHTLHGIFAGHEDTEEGYCAKYHANLGVHIEKEHLHCDILKTNTPVYDQPSFVAFNKLEAQIISSVNTVYESVYVDAGYGIIKGRAPPVLS